MAEAPEDRAEPRACSPCRGTGSVLSNAGGTQHTLPCPWCEGTGVEITGHDAQAARRDGAESTAPEPEVS